MVEVFSCYILPVSQIVCTTVDASPEKAAGGRGEQPVGFSVHMWQSLNGSSNSIEAFLKEKRKNHQC